jgi:hypothetical protein
MTGPKANKAADSVDRAIGYGKLPLDTRFRQDRQSGRAPRQTDRGRDF